MIPSLLDLKRVIHFIYFTSTTELAIYTFRSGDVTEIVPGKMKKAVFSRKLAKNIFSHFNHAKLSEVLSNQSWKITSPQSTIGWAYELTQLNPFVINKGNTQEKTSYLCDRWITLILLVVATNSWGTLFAYAYLNAKRND